MSVGNRAFRLVDRYLLRQIVRPMLISLAVALVVLLLERLLRLIDLVLGASGPLQVMIDIMAYLVPHYLGLALPLSLMLGILIAFNTLSRDSELDGLQSAGVGLMRLVRPVLVVAIVLTTLSGLVHGYLKPHARYAYQALVFSLNNVAVRAFVRSGIFTEIGEKTFFIQGAGDRGAGTGFGRTFVYDRAPGRDTLVITATGGSIGLAPEGMGATLRLRDGIRLTLPEQPATGPVPPSTPAILRFHELRTVLSNAGDMMFRPRGQDEREMTFGELWENRHQPPEGVRPTDIQAEFHVRLVRTASVMVIPLLAIPLGLGRRRSDRLHGITFCLLILVVLNHVAEFGKNLVQNGTVGPFWALWAPLIITALAGGWFFLRTATRVPERTTIDPLAPIVALLKPLGRLLARNEGQRT